LIPDFEQQTAIARSKTAFTRKHGRAHSAVCKAGGPDMIDIGGPRESNPFGQGLLLLWFDTIRELTVSVLAGMMITPRLGLPAGGATVLLSICTGWTSGTGVLSAFTRGNQSSDAPTCG
jgi:hypothetical protein